MRKSAIIVSFLILMALFVSPVSASAETKAGIKPDSFFYFFDTTFEKVGLFFTFSPEKKAQKALEYASERLAEVQAIEEEKNPDAIKTAITNYESNVALATEKSKEVKNKGQAENLFNLISDNASKNQEVLTGVLAKVPDEAKEAITRAIEASKRGQEEAMKQITELKKEIAGLKQEIENLEKKLESKKNDIENNGDKKADQTKEIDDLKDEIENLKKEAGVPTQQETKFESKEESKNNIVNLPSGAVVEMDANGNVVKTIKEAPEQTYIAPTPVVSTTQTQTLISIQISSVSVIPEVTTVRVEWQTDKPTESKLFLLGGDFLSNIYSSESGLSTRHLVSISGLKGNTNYSYEIEAIAGNLVSKKTGSFTTKSPPPPTISLLLPKRLNYGGRASWPNDNNYGNVNDTCNNCVVLITEMPTTANVSLMEYSALRGGAALDGFASNNPQSISIYADNSLSTTHVFLFSHLGMDQTKKYSFIVSAIDQNGNKYIQQFGGVDSNSNYLPGPFKWGENQTISWSSDYPSQYMKSNYYIDVPLTKVQ